MGGSTVFVSHNDIIVSFNIQYFIPTPAAYNSFTYPYPCCLQFFFYFLDSNDYKLLLHIQITIKSNYRLQREKKWNKNK